MSGGLPIWALSRWLVGTPVDSGGCGRRWVLLLACAVFAFHWQAYFIHKTEAQSSKQQLPRQEALDRT
jgi:hypothetical protein